MIEIPLMKIMLYGFLVGMPIGLGYVSIYLIKTKTWIPLFGCIIPCQALMILALVTTLFPNEVKFT